MNPFDPPRTKDSKPGETREASWIWTPILVLVAAVAGLVLLFALTAMLLALMLGSR